MTLRFSDRAPLGGVRKTQDGYLVAESFVARSGIQDYRRSELGLQGDDMVRVYRPEEEVRDVASIRTFSHAPITLGHPSVMVDSSNWADLAKGEVSTEAEWVDGKIRLPLIVKDEAAIAAVESGTAELSAGYTAVVDFTPGSTPQGESYDAVQRSIRVNHVAIVPRGRAGHEFRIGDGAESWGGSPATTQEAGMPDTNVRVALGDKTISVLSDDHPVLQKFVADQTATVAGLEAKVRDEQAKAEKLQAQLDAATARILTDEQVSGLIASRIAVLAQAALVAPKADFSKCTTDEQVRETALVSVLGEDVRSRSAAYKDARFDILVEESRRVPKNDAFADAMAGVVVVGDKDLEDARKAYLDNLTGVH